MTRFPPRRILAAVDLSPVSGRAWLTAQELAARFGASLRAVHCEPPLPAELEVYSRNGAQAADRARLAAELARRLGPQARLRLVRGRPEETLPRLARDLRFDLVVMGTNRRRGLKRALMGSVAEAVTRESPCPVLVAPRLRPIRRVLAPVGEADYALRGLAAAGIVARAFKARLTVLHVVTDPVFGPRPETLLSERIAELSAEVRRDARPMGRVARGEPVAEILRAAREHDLVVLAAHRKSLLGDWVLGTTVERVLRHSPVPVLSIPTGARQSAAAIS